MIEKNCFSLGRTPRGSLPISKTNNLCGRTFLIARFNIENEKSMFLFFRCTYDVNIEFISIGFTRDKTEDFFIENLIDFFFSKFKTEIEFFIGYSDKET